MTGRPAVHRPADLGELVAMVDRVPTADLVGGGTLAIPARYAGRRATPIISLRDVREMSGARPGWIGAATTIAAIAADSRLPGALAAVAGQIAGPAVRRQATVGGNLAAAQPGCICAVLLALRAEVALLRPEAGVPFLDWQPLADRTRWSGRLITAVRWNVRRRVAAQRLVIGTVGPVVATVAVGRGWRGPADWTPDVAVCGSDLSPQARMGAAIDTESERVSCLASLGIPPERLRAAAGLLEQCLSALEGTGR